MKKVLTIIGLAIISFVFPGHIFGQATAGGSVTGMYRNYNPTPPGPDASAFQKFGDLPVNGNAGIPQIEIPVYTIALNGFSWPLSLTYHASGFKSEDVGTRAGLGWSLNVSGMITKKQSLFGPGAASEVNYNLNLSQGPNVSASPPDYSTVSYLNVADIAIAESIVEGGTRVEPDMYYINAGTINGKFLNNGWMLPANDIRIVPVPGEAPQWPLSWNVWDEQGNKYEFTDQGQNISQTEYCSSMSNMSANPNWSLTKITTGRGEVINFIYVNEVFSYRQPDLHIMKYLQPGQLMACGPSGVHEDITCQNTMTAHEKKIVQITTSTGIQIDFLYSARNDITGSTKLDTIKINHFGQGTLTPVKELKLNYDYFGSGTNPDSLRLKLTDVSAKGINSAIKETYRFNYNNSPIAPKTTPSFWNGIFSVNEGGILEKIQYPTGGSTRFTYDVNTSLGLLRIKEIRDFAINDIETGYRKFDYADPSVEAYVGRESETNYFWGNPINGGPMSGVDGNPCIQSVNFLQSCTKTIFRSAPVKNTILDLMGDAVRYGHVTEFFGRNGENGKIEYDYGNFDYGQRTEADLHYLSAAELLKQKRTFKKNQNGVYELIAKTENKYSVPGASDSFYSQYYHTGKEKRFWVKKVFKLREEMVYPCCMSIDDDGDPVVTGTICYPKLFSESNFRIASLPVYLTSTKDSVFNGSAALSSLTEYFYEDSSHLKPTSVRTVNSKGDTIKTQIKYPHDFAGTAVYDSMVARNIITVVEQVKKNVTKNKELSRQKINYQLWNSGNLTEPSSVQQSFLGAALQTETVIDDYTAKGQIKQLTGKDGITTSFIRGYNDQYVVAKITGKAYADAISESGINVSVLNAASADNDVRTLSALLRSLSGCLVTTYTYKPLAGISSETDISGRTAYYEYDAFNRLALVRDNDSNIVKKICYNYYGQVEDCAGLGTKAVWQPTGATRCKACAINPAYKTNMIEREETDINPQSPTYGGTPRWVDFSTGNTCFQETDWVTDSLIPAFCDTSAGYNTSGLLRVQKNLNPCSPDYNTLRNTFAGINCTVCPKPPVWQATGDSTCQIDSLGQYTGNLMNVERNISNCSAIPYGTYRYVFRSYQPSMCSATGCNPNNCSGEGHKCISGVCETGIKVYTDSYVIDQENFIYGCVCHYEFSDSSWSGNYNEISNQLCF